MSAGGAVLPKLLRWTTVKGLVQFACGWHLFTEYIGEIRLTDGPSMIPTLSNEGDWVLKESISSRLNPPRLSIGDVVISVSPADPSRTVCKRILGLAGDTVCVDPEASVPHHIVVPKGHLWLMGDNYPHSRDSRTYGPVPMGLVRGKVVAVVWPRPRWLTNPLQPISGGLNSQSPQC